MHRDIAPPYSATNPNFTLEYLAKTESLDVAEALQRDYAGRGIEIMISTQQGMKSTRIFDIGIPIIKNPTTLGESV